MWKCHNSSLRYDSKNNDNKSLNFDLNVFKVVNYDSLHALRREENAQIHYPDQSKERLMTGKLI